MNDIVIIGAGGLGREVKFLIDEINRFEKKWNIVGFIDDYKSQDELIHGIKVLGKIDWLLNKSIYVACAIGDSNVRNSIITSLESNKKLIFPTLIHPLFSLSDTLLISEGVIVQTNVSITVDVEIGRFCIISPGVTIGHDTVLSNFVTILPGTNISGNVIIGEMATLGTGSKVIQNIKIGKNSLIGAGGVVTKDIPDNVVAVGVPAKPIRSIYQ